jgi:electron transfer flavoprotein beta subunit
MLNIIVCIKQVIDPEAPPSSFKIEPEAKRVTATQGTPPVLNPFDENALEAALKIKDKQPARITVLSMGQKLSVALLRTSLAVGADELVLLQDDIFDSFDAYFAAYVLAKAIKKMGSYDLVLCGRQAADSDAGQVGVGLAEMLGIPAITVAQKVEVLEGKVRVERVLSDGYEVVETATPALVTASNEIGSLRSYNLKALMDVQKKSITVWHSQDLGLNPFPEKRTEIVKLFIPVREVKSEIITGSTPEEAGGNLALKLREVKLI